MGPEPLKHVCPVTPKRTPSLGGASPSVKIKGGKGPKRGQNAANLRVERHRLEGRRSWGENWDVYRGIDKQPENRIPVRFLSGGGMGPGGSKVSVRGGTEGGSPKT